MCLITLAWQTHPAYDLVFAANRDEMYARPTDRAHFWPDAPQVFAGRDRRANGSWCGVAAQGRFAAVTNFREAGPSPDKGRSRGALVGDYLAGAADPRAYCEAVYAERLAYAGFSLLIGDAYDLFYLSNRDARGIQGVPPGVHALSNGLFDEDWPKTRRAAQGLRAALGPPRVDSDALLRLLADDRPAPDAELPDTGIGAELESMLSPIFIRGRQYGTCISTVILRERDGGLRFVERAFDAGGTPGKTVDRQWQPQPA